MSQKKVPGPPLKSTFKGALETLSTRWRAKLGFTKIEQEEPTDVSLNHLNGRRISTDLVQVRTNERKQTDVVIGDPSDKKMVELVFTKEGQVATRVLKYVPEGTAFPDFNELTLEATQEAQGNGWLEQAITTAPNLFGGFDYKIERPDRVPPDFGALLQTTEISQTVKGIASLPTLGVGELMREEQQITVDTKRVTVRARDLASLPKTIVNKDTSKEKLLVTVTRIWELDSATPASPDATTDVTFEKLGDGTALETRKVTAVFPGPVYGKSIENLIPGKFRAFIPTTTSDITSTGIADPNPTLGVGELSHEEQQMDAFNKRTKSVSFAGITPPITFTDQESDEQYGGAVLDVIYTLDVQGTLSVQTGLLYVKSEVVNLGNGYEIRTTRKNQETAWPELAGQDYDEQLDVVLPFTRQIKDAGAGIGTARTNIKTVDAWREESQTIDFAAAAAILDAYLLIYESRVNIDLPDKLISVTGILENSVGEGLNEETAGAPVFVGDYSISMSLRASAQSSANILPDTVILIKQFWGSNIKCSVIHFFLPSPVIGSNLIDKINDILSPLVISPWPKYNPAMATLTAMGQRVSLQVVASSQGSASFSGSGSSSTTEGGTGYSKEVGLTLKTIRISPTIHGEISVGGDTDATESISASATAEATGLGPAETSAQSASVNASITPTILPATDGDIDWPTSGYFLYRVEARPYKIGRIQFQCTVVNAADFPSNV